MGFISREQNIKQEYSIDQEDLNDEAEVIVDNLISRIFELEDKVEELEEENNNLQDEVDQLNEAVKN